MKIRQAGVRRPDQNYVLSAKLEWYRQALSPRDSAMVAPILHEASTPPQNKGLVVSIHTSTGKALELLQTVQISYCTFCQYRGEAAGLTVGERPDTYWASRERSARARARSAHLSCERDREQR